MKLNKAKTLEGYKLDSLDGEIGTVKDFYFDDQYWAVRYLVVDTGSWHTVSQVLISPYALLAVDNKSKNIAINLTKKKIEDSPSLNTDKPVSRQFEESYYGYYGWPSYWEGACMWGDYPSIMRDPNRWRLNNQGGKIWDSHLRSTQKVNDYHIQALDGEIGHVEDFIIDDESWAIRYLVINTHNWWPGKKVLISPKWIESVSWSESKIFVNVARETIKQSPEFTDKSLLTRDYESKLHQHYNAQGYWTTDELMSKGALI